MADALAQQRIQRRAPLDTAEADADGASARLAPKQVRASAHHGQVLFVEYKNASRAHTILSGAPEPVSQLLTLTTQTITLSGAREPATQQNRRRRRRPRRPRPRYGQGGRGNNPNPNLTLTTPAPWPGSLTDARQMHSKLGSLCIHHTHTRTPPPRSHPHLCFGQTVTRRIP